MTNMQTVVKENNGFTWKVMGLVCDGKGSVASPKIVVLMCQENI